MSQSNDNATKFPRNSIGGIKYHGVGASFFDTRTEVVILCPSIEALRSFVQEFGIATDIDDSLCRAAQLLPMEGAKES